MNEYGEFSTAKNYGDHESALSPAAGNNLTAEAADLAYAPGATPSKQTSPTDPAFGTRQLVDVSLGMFDKLDKNHDGYLERNELANAIQDPSIKGKEALALSVLYQSQFNMYGGAGHFDNGIWGGFKISKQDIQRLVQIEDSHADRVAVLRRVLEGPNEFTKFFAENRSKVITKDDLEKLAKNPKLSADEKQLIAFCAKRFSVLSDSSMSVEDLIIAFEKNNDEHIYRTIHGNLNRAKDFEPGASRSLYADKDNPLKSVKADAIRQGSIGDCYFEAALAGLAASDPKSIINMIKDNKNGTYTVTFPGAKDEPITITAPTETEQHTYNGMSQNGLWVNVLEKAYGTFCQRHFWRRNFLANDSGGRTPSEGASGGGWWGAMEMLTGKPAQEQDLSKSSPAAVAQQLDSALNGHPPRPIIAATHFRGENSFIKGHMYSVLAFKPDTKTGGTVTIRNPWGKPDSKTDFSIDGTYDIPLDVYMRNFQKHACAGK